MGVTLRTGGQLIVLASAAMRVDNWRQCVKWAKRALICAVVGVPLGAAVGAAGAAIAGMSAPQVSAFAGIWAITGPMVLTSVPLLVAAWFLFLHMLGQVGRAMRGTDDRP